MASASAVSSSTAASISRGRAASAPAAGAVSTVFGRRHECRRPSASSAASASAAAAASSSVPGAVPSLDAMPWMSAPASPSGCLRIDCSRRILLGHRRPRRSLQSPPSVSVRQPRLPLPLHRPQLTASSSAIRARCRPRPTPWCRRPPCPPRTSASVAVDRILLQREAPSPSAAVAMVSVSPVSSSDCLRIPAGGAASSSALPAHCLLQTLSHRRRRRCQLRPPLPLHIGRMSTASSSAA